jgi:hypothetical protein
MNSQNILEPSDPGKAQSDVADHDHPGRRQAPRIMQLEVALYIESLSAELRTMARASDLDALAYFLEMARIEASIQVERRANALDSDDNRGNPPSTEF